MTSGTPCPSLYLPSSGIHHQVKPQALQKYPAQPTQNQRRARATSQCTSHTTPPLKKPIMKRLRVSPTPHLLHPATSMRRCPQRCTMMTSVLTGKAGRRIRTQLQHMTRASMETNMTAIVSTRDCDATDTSFEGIHICIYIHIWLILRIIHTVHAFTDSKVDGANMGPTWGQKDPGGPHVGPINLAIWVVLCCVVLCYGAVYILWVTRNRHPKFAQKLISSTFVFSKL